MEPPAYDDDDDEQLQEQDAAAGRSVEQVFEGEPVPTPSEMFTARSVAVGAVLLLGATLGVVAIKFTLTSGVHPVPHHPRRAPGLLPLSHVDAPAGRLRGAAAPLHPPGERKSSRPSSSPAPTSPTAAASAPTS